MNWMPLFLIIASGAIMIPMLIGFQRFMGAIDTNKRAMEHQFRASENSMKQAQEEEAKIRAETLRAKADLEGLGKERVELEKALLKLKQDMPHAEEEDSDA